MAKFREKPVVIEAFQITEISRQDNSDWPEWLHRVWNRERHEVGAVFPSEKKSDGTDRLVVHTLRGLFTVSWNDWIIRGVNGELYPCKPDTFEKTYDVVE